MRRKRRRFLSLVTAASMLFTYPTVPFTVYVKADQGLETKQESKAAKGNVSDSVNDGGGGTAQ